MSDAPAPATEKLAPLIAVVGTDGSGKSTVSGALLEWLQRYGPADTAHLGLRSGDAGRAIKRLPLVGIASERFLQKKATRARDTKDKIPDPATAFVIYMFSVFRIRRFKKMMEKRHNGTIIITDRYPQTEVPGFYDGPGLSAARAEDAFTQRLARKEAAQYAWMASYVPDLVIRLNVDLETAFARKPDHKYESLRQKVAATPKLKFNGAKIVDLSSLDPLETVIAQAKAAIAEMLEAKGYTPKS